MDALQWMGAIRMEFKQLIKTSQLMLSVYSDVRRQQGMSFFTGGSVIIYSLQRIYWSASDVMLDFTCFDEENLIYILDNLSASKFKAIILLKQTIPLNKKNKSPALW